MSILSEATSPDLLFPELRSRDVEGVLAEMAARIVEALPQLSAADLARGFIAREALGSTALGGGLAVPHCKVKGITRAYLSIGLCSGGIDFGAADGHPVHVVCAVLSPIESPGQHLKLLAAISRWARQPERLRTLLSSRDRQVLMSQIQEGKP